MLDLTKRIVDYYELIWFDGEKLQIKRPSQALLMDIMALQTLPEEKQVGGMYDVLRTVVNNNTNKRVFSEEEINDIDFETAELIMEDYLQTVFPNLGQ